MANRLSAAGFIHRLRTDFTFASVSSLALTGVVAVTPFAAYRYLRGEWLIGTVDLLLVLCILASLGYALVTGRNRGAFNVIMAGGVAACLGVTYLVGLAGNFWTFPVLVGLYAVLPIRAALGLGCALTLTVVWVGKGLPTVVEVLSFGVTGVLVSGLAAISAYHVGRQRQALELAAATDALTGVGNRRRMDGDLEQSARLACRGSPLPALMVLDLDHFKRINDECGHEMGDRVLIEFANVVGKTLRQTDSLYRMGGEEFLVLLPMVEPTGIAFVAEKVRARVEEQLRSPLGPVTVSIGAVLYRRGESVAEWIARADAAVYEAKAQGRNGWSISPRIDGTERD